MQIVCQFLLLFVVVLSVIGLSVLGNALNMLVPLGCRSMHADLTNAVQLLRTPVARLHKRMVTIKTFVNAALRQDSQ
jgi:hypothetical protein